MDARLSIMRKLTLWADVSTADPDLPVVLHLDKPKVLGKSVRRFKAIVSVPDNIDIKNLKTTIDGDMYRTLNELLGETDD